jgi:hypothetical protein
LEDDEEVANFIRRLKKGIGGRYRGKLPLIFFFNYDGIGHFSNNCPHKKKKINEEDDSNRKQAYKGKRDNKKVFEKILCTKEDRSSSDEDEVGESETKIVLIMEVEDYDKQDTEEGYEEEEFYYKEELLSAIDVIKMEKKKNKSLQVELKRKEETQNSNSEELEQMISNLKIQLEEAKRTEEVMKSWIMKNGEEVEKLEE